MAAFAIYQHQHLVWRQAAQRGGVGVVGHAIDGSFGRVERRRTELHHLREFNLACSLQLFGTDYIHWHGAVHIGAGQAARTHHRHLTERSSRF